MKRALVLAVLFTLSAPQAAIQAATWPQWHSSHAIHVYAAGITFENLLTRDRWLALRRNKTAISYHHWQELRAAEVLPSTPPIEQGPPPGHSGDHLALLLCIHTHEGGWAANTGNGFWGGLQFAPSTWFGWGGGPFDGVGPFPYSSDYQLNIAEGAGDRAGWSSTWLHQQWPKSSVECGV